MSLSLSTKHAAVIALAALIGLAGCSTKVSRIETDEVRDLSGKWNDTDSRLVSEEMIGQMLEGAWVNNHVRRHGKQPTVIVGTVKNLSHEHVNVNTFVADIERAVINSGRVEFVASRDERGEIREERKDMDVHASEATRKAMGQEIGADYMLTGSINTIVDKEGKTAVRYYQVDMNLISLTDNRKVWVGQKKIKKVVEKPGMRL
ncbi:MAG: penicillin-binding protein activator LpoB [Thiohalomonadaceae bacterium]